MPKSKKELWLILISFFLIYIVWGSTYVANAFGIKEIPPFLFAASRFVLAGICLLGIARLFGALTFSWTEVRNTLFAGFLLFAIGNGFLVWSLKFIDSGLSALIVAFEPLLVVLLMWHSQGKRPDSHAWIGIALGILGISLLVGQPDFTNSREWVIGACAIFIAISAWAYVSVWLPKARLPESIFQSAAMQMLFGGLVMLVISYFLGEFTAFEPGQVTARSIWVMAYLFIFGSMLAFSAFNYLLKTVGPVQVSTCTFVNPVVALILGYWLNDEAFSSQSLVAAAIMLTGVVFINGHARLLWRYFKEKRTA